MGFGGFAGFSYAYKHPLDGNSRFLCLLFIRVVSMGLIIFEGPTSLLVSGVIIGAMCLLLLLNRCGCGACLCRQCCSGTPDEPIPEEPEPDLPRVNLPTEEEFYQPPPSHSPVVVPRVPEQSPRLDPFIQTPLRPQQRNTEHQQRANDTVLRAQPVPAVPSYINAVPIAQTVSPGFDFKDLPLPRSDGPYMMLPPIGTVGWADPPPTVPPIMPLSPADTPLSSDEMHERLDDVETVLKNMRKRLPQRSERPKKRAKV